MSKVKQSKKIEELLSDSSSEEVVQKKKTTKKVVKKVESSSDDSSSEEVLKKKTSRKTSNAKKENAGTAKKSKKVVESSSDDSSSEEVVKAPKKAVKKPVKKVETSDSDDSSSEEVVKKAPVKAAKKPVKKVVESSSDDSSSEEVVKKAPVKKVAKKVASSSDDDSSSEEVVKKAPKKVVKKAESSDDEESIEFKAQPKPAELEVPESTCSELFCKNLPWSADENKLYEFFGTYGTVNNVKVLYDRTTGKARGLAFVDFSSRAEAQKALDDQANLFIDSRNVQCSFSDNKPQPQAGGAGGFQKPAYGQQQQGGYGGQAQEGAFEKKWHDGEKFTAFVGNLGFKTTPTTIGQFFGVCGNVLDVRIASDRETGRSKGYAHVDFDSQDAVTKAIAKAGENLDGRDVRVDTSTPRVGGGGDRK
jgi:nucleolin